MRCSRVLIASGILGFVGAQAQAVPAQDHALGPVLFYRQPAREWVEALPIGNGRLGGMVFGGVPAERIQLNEDTFWSGGPYDPINSTALQYLPTVRQLIRDGRYKEAQDLADEKLMGRPRHLQAYQPLGDLRLVVEGHEHPTHYRRELDLDRAVVRVRYRIGDTTFTREVFSSAPDQSIVVRLTADGPAKLSLRVTLDSKQPFAVRPLPPRGLLMTGRWRGDLTKPDDHLKLSRGLQARWYGEGLAFAVQIAAEAQGGRVEVDEKGLHVVGAESVTLRLAAATSFKGRNPEAACAEALRASRPYVQMLARHLADHRTLFRRVRLDLGSTERDALPTDERLAAVRGGAVDPGLAATYFQYGRYLLIASSRPGTQPANLQGLWNDEVNPAWGSKYTININTEMNYWPAEVTNLSELQGPLFDLIDKARVDGRHVARAMYGANGFVIHHNTDGWGHAGPIDGVRSGIWPMGGAWLSLHTWDHYDFTRDREFLRTRAYPVLKEAAEFLLDYMVTDREGRLVTGPSISPENQYKLPDGTAASLAMGPYMDTEIARALFGRAIAASEILGTDQEFRNRLQAARQKLPALKIGRHGQLQEWLEDYDEREPGHRHISHLFALHPGNEVTPRGTPELARAARITLERRLAAGGGGTGWSRAWIVNFWARLEEGDKAHENFVALLANSTQPNMLDSHPPFQIDGNFGGVAGITEMLLQSHAGEIAILPALPSAWAAGSITGLRARGAVGVDLRWERGQAVEVRLRPDVDGEQVIRPPRGQRVASVTLRGTRAQLTEQPDGTVRAALSAGREYVVSFATDTSR
jgi:alpha-L-fucosidase 2